MTDLSPAISLGVIRWMDANKDAILEVLSASAERAADTTAQLIASGVMMKVGKFLDENRAEIITASAAAIASAYERRVHGPMQRMEGA